MRGQLQVGISAKVVGGRRKGRHDWSAVVIEIWDFVRDELLM